MPKYVLSHVMFSESSEFCDVRRRRVGRDDETLPALAGYVPGQPHKAAVL
ncbi:hypothetical protein RMR21_023085 (plasmid) [Agrobacterium sp. rho-8.1]|nr:hypothetical protein [Agrobacterium sp. rho-8.1]